MIPGGLGLLRLDKFETTDLYNKKKNCFIHDITIEDINSRVNSDSKL